ncbi:MAG: response regulator transcription factor [Bacillota bacterium]
MPVTAGRVLIVDDEPSLVELVRYNLERAGFATVVASSGDEALALAASANPDVIVLDILLPGLDGLEVCRRLRAQGVHVPVLMLTALGDETDRVVGLEVGADDYLTKPFSPRELVARVRALVRRSQWSTAAPDRQPGVPRADAGPSPGDDAVRIGDLLLDRRRREVRVAGRPVNLTPTEYRLLEVLASVPGRAFRRDELLDALWGEDFVGDPRVADVHISHLRAKIEDDPSAPRYIHTVRGYGYRLDDGAASS